MKYVDLIQRLQHNPDEAVIFYTDNGAEGVTWIINRQGVVQHKHEVDDAMIKALGAGTVRHVASLVPSRAAIF